MRDEGLTVVVAHNLPLSQVSGTTVVLRALLDELAVAEPGSRADYLDVSRDATPVVSLRRLQADRPGGLHLLGVNLHVERHWERSVACFDACRQAGIPSSLWVHDYWPHNEPAVRSLVGDHAAVLLASTRTVRDALAGDGLAARLLQAGVALTNLAEHTPRPVPAPFVVGTAGRVVRRKRQIDVVQAFARAQLGPSAALRLRMLPSLVHPAADDEEVLTAMLPTVEEARRAGSLVVVDREPTARHDYRLYSVFVCSSDYEGFSMTPIEATYCGCPAVMSDIPAHREIAEALYPDAPSDVLFAPGDVDALADRLRDEAGTGRRRARLWDRLDEVHATVEARWSMRGTARALLDLVRAGQPVPESVTPPSATDREAGAARPAS